MPKVESSIPEINDVSSLGYAILSLTNPYNWPNESDVEGLDYFVTTKDIYVWPVIFESYAITLYSRKQILYNKSIEKIKLGIEKYAKNALIENPMDFSDASRMYVGSKPGSFQSIRMNFGAAPKNLQIPDAGKMVERELNSLEGDGLIVDPFFETIAGTAVFLFGAIPHSFTKRTEKGDEVYRKIKAILWEYESLTDGEKREVRVHFFMEKVIQHLKKTIVEYCSAEERKTLPSNEE